MLKIENNKSLDALTTFHLSAEAEAYVEVETLEALREAFVYAREKGLPVKVFGGGSNIVAMPRVSGLVMHPAFRGIRFEADEANKEETLLTAGAGESLDGVVRAALSRGFGGLENLSAIPGHIGGAVVQNVGAYGLELAERFVSARVYDAETDEVRVFDLEACDFAYRMSVFKRPENEGRFVVLDATLRLPKVWTPVLGYKALAERVAGCSSLTPEVVADAVRAIRAEKLPDPAVIGSAGSFFKNPIVTIVKARELLTQNGSLVTYPIGGDRVKLAAGWLIDACGFKGAQVGDAAVYEKHALIIVNRGHATGEDVAALAQTIISRVEKRFGVTLEPEPVFMGA